ncbi:MAG: tRNA 2-thiocytidine(32) synthetase TtcA [Candidatus Omnitrophica bacterium]|nr:tRNA 2-thiocytidine(32) synthetase TtcA [Candidatus Omnitrophota bacterium]
MSEENEKKIKMKGIIKQIYKKMGKAISDYRMIEENDRILIGFSGGVDSLSLLKLFQMRKTRILLNFDFSLCYVSANFTKVDSEVILKYFREQKIDYTIKELCLNGDNPDCFWCSWNRRKILFDTARKLGCNKLALGHNLDDITETILMNLCFAGEISTMKPKLELFEGRLTIIRPLCYIEKKDLLDFVSELNLPVVDSGCSRGKDSKRALIKKVISEIEKDCPYLKKNIFNSLKRIKQDYLV